MLKPTLFKKFLFPSLLIALGPLFAASILLFTGLDTVRDRLAAEVGRTADNHTAKTLQYRAMETANSIADFLQERESDLMFLSRFVNDRQAIANFYISHKREVWEIRDGREIRERIPLYHSVALTGPDGMEKLCIRKGIMLGKNELKNVSVPANTEFKNENYFEAIKRLPPGEIYVSHLTGFHTTIKEQNEGKRYEGVIRFGTPLYTTDGRFDGALVISLDHRHLMEFSQHIDPGPGYIFAEPRYESTNYAFIFDHEGWIITHPKYWDIRGVDASGRAVPCYNERSTTKEIKSGRIPFNLLCAGFIHPNYPFAAKQTQLHKSGTLETTNVGGQRKIMAYAPILYNSGVYSRHGIFGGVTIGFQFEQYHRLSSAASLLISSQLKDFIWRGILVMALAAVLAGLASWRLARGIIKPIQELNQEARRLADGDSASEISVKGSDELAQLTSNFNEMARELDQRRESLLSTLRQLEDSRLEILNERDFKESILESISSAIITLDTDGRLTSGNSTAVRLLQKDWPLGSHFTEILSDWDNLPERIECALKTHSGYGREPLTHKSANASRHFDTGIFPIGPDASLGLTVTMRDETIREELREETIRLDRLASLGRLAAGISHEIRNPLTGVSLLLDDLHDRAQLSIPDREMLGRALSEIERVERLVASLLSFASPPRANLRTGRLDETVREISMLLSRQFSKQRIELVLDSNLPDPILFDSDKIRQALLNLINNGQEAMPDGGKLTISVFRQEDFAVIKVSDTGQGIDEKDIPLIFEPFFTRKGAGTGLGLSITRRIIEEHSGNIIVEKQPEAGTCFTICLPLKA